MKKIKFIIILIVLSFIGCSNDDTSYAAAPLNKKHQFIFNWCDFTYNGQIIPFGKPLEEFIAIAGPYDRKNKDFYTWDNISTRILADYKTNELVEFVIHYSLENNMGGFTDEQVLNSLKSDIAKQGQLKFISSKPKKHFLNSLMIDGVLMDENFPGVEPINKARFKWAKANHKTYPDEVYDPILGKGRGTRARFDLDGNPIVSKQIDYLSKVGHATHMRLGRSCGNQDFIISFDLHYENLNKIHRVSISLIHDEN